MPGTIDRTAQAVVLTRAGAPASGLRLPGWHVEASPLPAGPAAVRAALEAYVDRAGAPDAVVNVLAQAAASTPTEDARVEAWQRRVDVNLTASLVASQVLGTAMLAAGRGTIVTVLAGQPEDGVTAITDRAAVGLMRVLAVEWAPAGVRVATIAPEGPPGLERDAAVAAAVAFLVGPDGAYVTGSELTVTAP